MNFNYIDGNKSRSTTTEKESDVWINTKTFLQVYKLWWYVHQTSGKYKIGFNAQRWKIVFAILDLFKLFCLLKVCLNSQPLNPGKNCWSFFFYEFTIYWISLRKIVSWTLGNFRSWLRPRIDWLEMWIYTSYFLFCWLAKWTQYLSFSKKVTNAISWFILSSNVESYISFFWQRNQTVWRMCERQYVNCCMSGSLWWILILLQRLEKLRDLMHVLMLCRGKFDWNVL